MRDLAAFLASVEHLGSDNLVEAVRAEVLRTGGGWWLEDLDDEEISSRASIAISLHHIFASGRTTAEACEAWRASARRAVHALTTIEMEDYPVTTETMDRALPPGCVEVGGKVYMPDAKGNLVPKDLVAAQTQLEDETVRKVMGHARDLSSQIGRFRGHTMTDLGELDALIAQEYGLTKGGPKGNRTYQTFDGCQKVEVRVADYVDFGPELQVAKALLDECLREWAAESRPEIQAIVTRAFNTDKEGQINRSEIFMLLRLAIEDERWGRAMTALRDAMRVTGSKEHVRFYERGAPTDAWRAVTVDIAKSGEVRP